VEEVVEMREELRAILAEITSVVRATDTFKALIIGAADGLDERARQRTSLAADLQTAKDGGEVTGGQTKVDLAALSEQLKRESEAQGKLALRRTV
jgi:hypothetical protein